MNKSNYVTLSGTLVKDAIIKQNCKGSIMYSLPYLYRRYKQDGMTISTA
ncbi:MAG: hypothetical protein PUE66_06895 [Erysipelotrichaceae bacterium]|nr:hypothetical protein [Erysipelotrichaceae bacterium]